MFSEGKTEKTDRSVLGKVTGWIKRETYRDHQRLVEAYNLLDATLEATADGILAVDRELNILKYNRKFIEMFSIPRELYNETDKMKLLNVILPQLKRPQEFWQALSQAAAKPDTNDESTIEFNDGRIFRRTSKPHVINGEVIGRVLSFTDITVLRRSEEQLEQMYRKLKFHIDNSPLAVIEFDSNQRITGWSKMAETIFGWKVNEVLGKKYDELDIVYKDDLEDVARNVVETVEQGNPNIHRNRNLSKDGKLLWCEWYNSPMYDEEGRLASVLSVVKDISETVRANDELKRSSQFNMQIVNGIQDGLVVVDRDFNIRTWNPAMEQMTGIRSQDVVNKNTILSFPELEQAGMIGRLKKAFEGEMATFDLENPQAAGAAKWSTNRVIPLTGSDNTVTGAMVMVHDISKLKEVEDSLRVKIGRLTELNQELEDYAYAIQELSQFSYVASHQLQAPVRTITNFINVIREDYGGSLDDKVLGYLETISSSAGRMSELIDALLAYARIGRKSTIEECDINVLIKDLLTDLSFLIESSGAVVEVSEMPVLNIHKTEFRQLIHNLVSNAIKFQKQGNIPRVRIYAERLEDKWRFAVSDNGIGIHSKYFDKIFEIFQRLHVDENVYEGKGIGLAYCKKIVELHKGELWVESFCSNGCTFFFTIPD